MLHRIVHLLLVAALVFSGASAPFMHVHAHGSGHGSSSAHGEAVDEHCAHHHAEGTHWHPAGSPDRGTGGTFAPAGSRHRHAAVALSAAAIEVASIDVGASCAQVAAPETGIPPLTAGARAPVAADAGPDPPPSPHRAARAPPVRS